LETRTREVERLNDLKSEFLASTSHELRTPLSAIIGFSTLLEEEKVGTLTQRQRDFLKHISQAANHLLAVINDILDLSRIEAGHLELHEESFRFCEVLTEVLATIRPLVRAKNINFSIGNGTGELVYADRLRLKQILYNLLNNAIKFTPDYGDVSVECLREQDSVLISVTDNGIGVPPEEQQAIFEKFHQAAQPLGVRREGTGLGLAITRQLVERHGGKIWIESVPGSMTRFRFRLPAAYSIS
jgi:signal transduction histidine kinase